MKHSATHASPRQLSCCRHVCQVCTQVLRAKLCLLLTPLLHCLQEVRAAAAAKLNAKRKQLLDQLRAQQQQQQQPQDSSLAADAAHAAAVDALLNDFRRVCSEYAA